jgi:uncharacterized protein YodC (DUF2158 family)
MIMNEEKIFFTAGDVVQLRQDIPNKPKMVVHSIDKIAATGERPMLFGITCFWFTTLGEYQKERFNTKDLVHLEK